MTRSARRARPGLRRDGEVRTLSTTEVRYPEPDPRAPQPVDEDECRASGRTLYPARDTGLALQGRLAREARRRERARRQRTAVVVTAVIGVALLALGWRYSSDEKAASLPMHSAAAAVRETPTPAPANRTGAPQPGETVVRAAAVADPTPIIARRGSVTVRLPVRLDDLTEMGFHQASYPYALSMKLALPIADMKAAKKARSTKRDLSKQSSAPNAALTGRALIMWRSRPGKPDTAVDVGAKAGSDVLAPVSGTVVKVKRYKLYGTHDDYEIHIRPLGAPTIDCVMIHVDDLSVKAGDEVTAGVTRIAAVRMLSDRENLQLADYTKDGGDHVHVQLNNARHPDYKGLEGALAPAAKARVTPPLRSYPELVR
ncbi:MAG: M23 family metallopeptidase [Coriobacteriia bacterium]|nr:M23 family metallopeptidase [Coriobacteriia bacterium]